MKTLLVNNSSLLLKELQADIPGDVTVIPWDDIGTIDAANFDLVVLSGGSAFSIVGNEEKLKSEVMLIRSGKKPLIGICFGCELIATAFGGVLEKMGSGQQGKIRIVIEPAYRDIFGMDEFISYEHHA
jgi:GMP synthase-like glutamine amidotransferase